MGLFETYLANCCPENISVDEFKNNLEVLSSILNRSLAEILNARASGCKDLDSYKEYFKNG